MWNYNHTDELYHYGVIGMKWGVRKARKYQGKASQARKSAKEWDEIAGRAEKKGKSKKATKYRSYADKDRRDADTYDKKAANINQEVAKTKAAVGKYRKNFNSWNRTAEAADRRTSAAKEAYKALGKTKLSRFINAARNKTPESKKYNKMMDDATRMSDIADQKWKSVRNDYKKTGRSAVSRILNNIHYDSLK